MDHTLIPAGAALASKRYPAQRPEFLGEEVFYLLIGAAQSKQPDELLPVYPLSVYRANRQQYLPQTVLRGTLELCVVII